MAFTTGPYRDTIQGPRNQGQPIEGNYGQAARATGVPYYSFENAQTGTELGEQYGKSARDPRIFSNAEFENELSSSLLNFKDTELGQRLMSIIGGQPDVSGIQDVATDIRRLPDFFNAEEGGRISNLITGKAFDRDIAGSLFDQISRSVAPQIEADRARLGRAGINPEAVSGILSSAIGERDRAFTDAATQYQLTGTEIGLRGRGQEEESRTGRLDIIGQLEKFMAELKERGELGRGELGLTMQGQDLDIRSFLLELSRQQDLANKGKKTVLEGAGEFVGGLGEAYATYASGGAAA